MEKVAEFSKVSQARFLKDCEKNTLNNITEDNYNSIKLPHRATTGSAGYDFFAPFDFSLKPGEEITVPSGIRCKMENGYVLMLFPRSGLGFKYGLRLNNTVGIIDSDYFFSDNEGHIMIRMTNASKEKTLTLKQGDGFAQGVFVPFAVTYDDNSNGIRNGGFGSTTKD